MGHPLRIDEPGLIHHVHGQASDHRASFRDDQDFEFFTSLVTAAAPRFGIRVLAMCLMSTHYHAALYSIDGRLSAAMQWILSRYVRYYNARYETNGSLFRGRFKSSKVESGPDLARLVRYIHANALDLPGVERAEDHRWSTCSRHATTRPAPRWLMRAAVAYVLRSDSRLSKDRTKTHRSAAAASDPARVPAARITAALAHFGTRGFVVRPHPQPRPRGPTEATPAPDPARSGAHGSPPQTTASAGH